MSESEGDKISMGICNYISTIIIKTNVVKMVKFISLYKLLKLSMT